MGVIRCYMPFSFLSFLSFLSFVELPSINDRLFLHPPEALIAWNPHRAHSSTGPRVDACPPCKSDSQRQLRQSGTSRSDHCCSSPDIAHKVVLHGIHKHCHLIYRMSLWTRSNVGKDLPSETGHIPNFTATITCHIILFYELDAVIRSFDVC